MLVEIIDRILIVPPSTLAVALTRITTDKQFSFGKLFYRRNVIMPNCLLSTSDRFVQFTCRFAGIICPNRLDSDLTEPKVAPPATGEERDCFANLFSCQ